MKKITLCFLLLPSLVYSQTWIKKQDFPDSEGKGRAVSFALNNEFYVGTGIGSEGFSQRFFKYNPTTNSWALVPNFPGAGRHSAVSFVLNNKGYAGTGQKADGSTLNDFYEYNPATNTWTRVSPISGNTLLNRTQATAFALNNKGFVIYGSTDSNPANPGIYPGVEVYDPATGLWKLENVSPPTGQLSIGQLNDAVSFTINGKAYIYGGTYVDNNSRGTSGWLYEFKFTNSAPWYNQYAVDKIGQDGLIIPKARPAVVTTYNAVYFIGGYYTTGFTGVNETFTKTIYKWNALSNVWTKSPVEFPEGYYSYGLGADLCGKNIVALGNVRENPDSGSESRVKSIYEVLLPIDNTISGPQTVCTTNSVFTVQNPFNYPVNWQVSSNLVKVSGDGTSSLTVKQVSGASPGTAWVKPVFITCGQPIEVPQKNIWVGKPDFPQPISGSSELLVGSSGRYTVATPGAVGSAVWNVQPNWEMYSSGPNGNGSAAIIIANSIGYKIITVSTSNTCGSSSTQKTVNGVTSCSSTMTVSPNPTKGDIVVNIVPPPGGCGGAALTMQTDASVNSIDVLDGNGTKVYSSVFTGELMELRGLDLKKGTYFLKVLYQGTRLEKRVIVN